MTTTELRKAADHASRRAADTAADGATMAQEAVATTWSDALEGLRSTAGDIGNRLPGIASAGVDGATESVRVLQDMPESRLDLLAAFSLGAGSCLLLVGAPRLVTLVALAPAILVGISLAMRQDGDQEGSKSGGKRGRRN